VGHHQVETRISEKTQILQCGHQEWGNEILFYNVWGGVTFIHLISTSIESPNGDDATKHSFSCLTLYKTNNNFVREVNKFGLA
jgi:hypothetical protein